MGLGIKGGDNGDLYNLYTYLDAFTLETMKNEVMAEMSRQRLAGQDFGLPGGRTRHGIRYDHLVNELVMISYAQSLQVDANSGQQAATQVTVADLSG